MENNNLEVELFNRAKTIKDYAEKFLIKRAKNLAELVQEIEKDQKYNEQIKLKKDGLVNELQDIAEGIKNYAELSIRNAKELEEINKKIKENSTLNIELPVGENNTKEMKKLKSINSLIGELKAAEGNANKENPNKTLIEQLNHQLVFTIQEIESLEKEIKKIEKINIGFESCKKYGCIKIN